MTLNVTDYEYIIERSDIMFFSRPAGDKFVDRGIISDYDFDEGSLTQDGAYHDLDLSAIIPCGNIPVLIQFVCNHTVATKYMKVKKKGATNDYQAFVYCVHTADKDMRGECIVFCDKDRKLEYLFDAPAWLGSRLTVMGWWV